MGVNMSIPISLVEDMDPSLLSRSNSVAPKDLKPVYLLRHGQQSIESIRSEARAKLGINVETNINYAFVGRPGVGKSSLINALRGMSDTASGAAPVGVVETTTEIKKYAHPEFGHIVLWDFPGVGTVKQPESNYFENNMLYAFDCIVILSSDRFTAIDYSIAYKANEYKVNCVFLRTKADLGIKALAVRQGTTMLEAGKKFREQVKKSFNEGIRATCGDQDSSKHIYQLFILSAWAFHDTKQTYSVFSFQRRQFDNSLIKMDEGVFIYFLTRSIHSRLSV